jgi:hypothetical protein
VLAAMSIRAALSQIPAKRNRKVEAARSRLLKNHCSNHDARYNDFAR